MEVGPKCCSAHWGQLREAIEVAGLMPFVAKGGEAAASVLSAQLSGKGGREAFEPLLSANFAIMNNAIAAAGYYLMGQRPGGGLYCPMCESEAHGGHPAAWWISHAVDEQVAKARELGLLPRPS